MDSILKDIRYGFRGLLKRPGGAALRMKGYPQITQITQKNNL